MADEPMDASLLGRSDSQSTVEVPANTSHRRSGMSDLKIAGVVLLVCMFVAGQGLTAYFILNQKSQISDLEDTANLLKIKMSQGSSTGRMIQMPMHSASLMMLSNEDSKKSTPMKKLENTVIVTLEKQVKDLLQDTQLPQFNETFLANLQALKSQMQDEDWMRFESWMRHWLVFQMAQQKPPEPTPTPAAASGLQTKCQVEAGVPARIGFYRPQCDEQGNYKPVQCWHSTGFCWCVDRNGEVIPGTSVRGKPMCQSMSVARRKMATPSLTRLMKDVPEN